MVSESTLRRIERFKKGLEILKEISEVDIGEYLSDIKLQSIAERNLQICVEVIVDLSNIIISKKGFRIPSSYRDVIKVLEENKVLDEDLAEKMIDIVSLRNIIVHMYADIKSEIIHANLQDMIETLKEVMNTLLEYCKKNNVDP